MMNNSVYGKRIKKKDTFKLMNNSVHGKAINAKFVNNKKCEPYKNEFLEKETKKLFHKLVL